MRKRLQRPNQSFAYLLSFPPNLAFAVSKLPVTIKAIARQLSLSISTVSRALQDHPSIGLRTRERVQALAKQLQYTPNQIALSLKHNRRYTLGVVLPDLLNPFFIQILEGIQEVAISRGYLLTICSSHEKTEDEKRAVRLLTRSRVDGFLIAVAQNGLTYEHLHKLTAQEVPLVLLDRPLAEVQASSVTCDLRAGADALTCFLIEKGLRRIAHLQGPAGLESSRERREGFLRAMQQHGLEVGKDYVQTTDLTTAVTEQATHALLALRPRPEAIVAFNDYVALDAGRIARLLGLRVNEDLVLVSFGNHPMSAYLNCPPLATIEQHAYSLGAQATEMLLRRIESPALPLEHIRLQPQLVINQFPKALVVG